MNEVRIRKARPDEGALISEIEADAAERFRGSIHAYVVDHPPAPAEVYAGLAAEELVILAEVDGAPVGFAACQLYPDALHLAELAVRQAAQGSGIGRRLADAAAAEAQRRGYSSVTLTTFANVDWNAPWYRRMGFNELRAGELGERLRAQLEREYGRGLTDRCAMRLPLSAP